MSRSLRTRVHEVAERVLAEQHVVRPVDVLVGLGWVAEVTVERWQQGRIEHLGSGVASTSENHAAAMAELTRWATERGLTPTETPYLARNRDRRPLRFGADDDSELERTFRTHWYSPELPGRREQLVEEQARPPELVVVAATRDWTCTLCGTPYDAGRILLMEAGGPTCLACADLDHLELLPAGHTALTRRAKRASRLSAVVVRWSRSRKRYERIGILAEPTAIEQAEAECLGDAEVRERRRARDAERRLSADDRFVDELTAAVRAQFPGGPGPAHCAARR